MIWVIPPHEPTIEAADADGVIDLAARRNVKALEQEVTKLKERLAEATAYQNGPMLDNGKSHGGDTGQSECRFHPAVIVDESRQLVLCKHCGAEVNPFVVLAEFSRRERQMFMQLKWNRDEKRELREDIEKLKKERKNLRNQVNAARHKLKELKIALSPDPEVK